MIYWEVEPPLYVYSEDRSYSSRVVGFEATEDGIVTEVFTQYGSVPASLRLVCEILRSARPKAVAA